MALKCYWRISSPAALCCDLLPSRFISKRGSSSQRCLSTLWAPSGRFMPLPEPQQAPKEKVGEVVQDLGVVRKYEGGEFERTIKSYLIGQRGEFERPI